MKMIVTLGLAALAAGCVPMASQTGTAGPTTQHPNPPGDWVEGVDFTRREGQPSIEETYPDAAGMPRDVQAYIIRHSDCTHWQGEPGFNADRQRQIDEAVREACGGVDALGVRIRSRYANNPAVIERLREYGTVES